MRAAGAGAGEVASNTKPRGTPAADLIQEALQARAEVMFSGATGMPVESGITDDVAAVKQPTYALISHRLRSPSTPARLTREGMRFRAYGPAHPPWMGPGLTAGLGGSTRTARCAERGASRARMPALCALACVRRVSE